MGTIYQATDDLTVLSTYEPVPGFGVLPINMFVLKGEQNVLVDTGLPNLESEVLDMVDEVAGPKGIDWILLSHADRDHSGNLQRILEVYPRAKVGMNFTTFAKVAVDAQVPMSRLYAVNPGQTFTAGDRTLQIYQPPLYDAGGSIGFYHPKSGVLFAADSFGAIIPQAESELANVPAEPFAIGFSLFNRANSPWVVDIDTSKFAQTLGSVAAFQPRVVVATHLPVARGRTEALLQATAELTAQGPAPIPDQAAIEAMLARMTGSAV